MRSHRYWIYGFFAMLVGFMPLSGARASPSFYDPLYVSASAVDFDVGIFVEQPAHVAVINDTIVVATVFDGAGISYLSGNQPTQKWRTAVDAYSHIDPGRRLI